MLIGKGANRDAGAFGASQPIVRVAASCRDCFYAPPLHRRLAFNRQRGSAYVVLRNHRVCSVRLLHFLLDGERHRHIQSEARPQWRGGYALESGH